MVSVAELKTPFTRFPNRNLNLPPFALFGNSGCIAYRSVLQYRTSSDKEPICSKL